MGHSNKLTYYHNKLLHKTLTKGCELSCSVGSKVKSYFPLSGRVGGELKFAVNSTVVFFTEALEHESSSCNNFAPKLTANNFCSALSSPVQKKFRNSSSSK